MPASTFYNGQAYFTTSLNVGGGIDASQTTGIVLQSVAGITDITKPGICLVTYANPIDTAKAEWMTFTSIDVSNELQGVTRGTQGYGAHTHLQDAVIVFPVARDHINEIIKALNGTNSGVTLTSPVINTPTITTPVVRNYDGWIDANETWTYASASTITVPAGATAKYQIGDRIKWTQTSVKYGIISNVADTVLTIIVNTGYVVDNAAISANYYSHEATPVGMPARFSFTIGYTGFSSNPTTTLAQYSVIARKITIEYIQNALGTSNANTFTMTGLPATIATNQASSSYLMAGADNSANLLSPVWGYVTGTTLVLKLAGANNWTTSGTKGVYGFVISYEF